MYELIICMFAIGMAFGVTIGVGILFVIQIKIIAKNQTGIESWILKKANHRREYSSTCSETEKFIYPYDLGFKENMRQVFNWTGNFRSIGDGISWNVIEGCDQYTLTVEQLAQKEEKRVHSVKYNVVKNYSGSIFTCSHGCKTCICVPWSEEPRISISVNEVVSVTRWQKHWLYGEVVKNNELEKDDALEKNIKINKKGWFPYKCVRIAENQQNVSGNDEEDKLDLENDTKKNK